MVPACEIDGWPNKRTLRDFDPLKELISIVNEAQECGAEDIDTTVQPKAVAFPTDAKLMHRARERLVKLARKTGVELRQSYARVGKHALIAHQRYAHAKQFKRGNRALRTIHAQDQGRG